MNTYSIKTTLHVGGGSRSAIIDAAFDELLPICLGASYLCGQAVSPTQSLPMSSISFCAVGDHFPRQRSMTTELPVCATENDFIAALGIFVLDFKALETRENARLLIHHWLDGLACWSLEDLVLSTATMLEIIAATAGQHAKTNSIRLAKNNFTNRIDHAATRFSLPPLPPNFRHMRNDLVHEGTLSGTGFAGKNRVDCAHATSECLAWIDNYLHHAFNLGAITNQRFTPNKYIALNAFSL